MSDIIVNQKNLSRFTKRLQKSLSKNLTQEIPLHLASLILAETFGVDSIHHLQQKLTEETKDETLVIKELIENYFSSNLNTKILGFSIIANDFNDSVSFNISAKSKKYEDEEGFGIFLGENSSYIDKELNNLDLSFDDLDFIKQLVSKLHFNDLPKSLYLGAKLKDFFNIKKRNTYYSFKNSKNFESVTNYGFCESIFVLVEEDFFEKVGAPFTLNNDHYCFIDLNNTNHKFFNDINSGINAITQDTMLLEFKTPINQSSSLIQKSQYKVQGICSHYIYLKNNQKIATTVNLSFSNDINDIKDYFYFLGKNKVNIDKHFNIESIPVNHPYKDKILEGSTDARNILSNNKIKKTK